MLIENSSLIVGLQLGGAVHFWMTIGMLKYSSVVAIIYTFKLKDILSRVTVKVCKKSEITRMYPCWIFESIEGVVIFSSHFLKVGIWIRRAIRFCIKYQSHLCRRCLHILFIIIINSIIELKKSVTRHLNTTFSVTIFPKKIRYIYSAILFLRRFQYRAESNSKFKTKNPICTNIINPYKSTNMQNRHPV